MKQTRLWRDRTWKDGQKTDHHELSALSIRGEKQQPGLAVHLDRTIWHCSRITWIYRQTPLWKMNITPPLGNPLSQWSYVPRKRSATYHNQKKTDLTTFEKSREEPVCQQRSWQARE